MTALKDDLTLMLALLDVALHEPHGEAISEARCLIDQMLFRHVRDELRTDYGTDGDNFNRSPTYEERKRRVSELRGEAVVDGPGGVFDRGGR